MKKDPKKIRQKAAAMLLAAKRIEDEQFISLGKLAQKLYDAGELKDEKIKAAIEGGKK